MVLENSSQWTFRRINEKKRQQLVSLYKEIIEAIFLEEHFILRYKILISKVGLNKVSLKKLAKHKKKMAKHKNVGPVKD